KKAAEDPWSNCTTSHLPKYLRKGILPSSVSALKQAQKALLKGRWANFWKQYPRHKSAAKHKVQDPSPKF
ncbi:hypothetical protein PAXRUDRAFT_85344, partial [Paxillus rubicundulus Ve08.2h10]